MGSNRMDHIIVPRDVTRHFAPYKLTGPANPAGPTLRRRANDSLSGAYFPSAIFFKVSKPPWYTPLMVSIAVWSFSLSPGLSPTFLRLK